MDPKEIEARLKALEERQQATEDLEAIKQLQYRYMNAFMFADWDTVLDCFTEDAVIDVTVDKQIKGKAEIEKIYREELGKGHVGSEGDFVIHPIISVNGDTAEGNWMMYMMYAYKPTGQSLFWVQGMYDAKYIKINGKWKFSYLYHKPRMAPNTGGPPPFPGTF